jgi:EAL domain-containing protein (putative c-di-GMP-specific phosphodiesterase class I)
VAERLRETIAAPLHCAEHELAITCSVGIALFPADGVTPDNLVKNADTALRYAKECGKNTTRFYSSELNARALQKLSLTNELRRAIERDELRLYYQPKVDLRTDEVVGTEALVRWQHPERGLVLPAEFIHLAEDTGQILKIGEWVLRQSCRWATFIGAQQGLQISVNLSARQFNDPQLPKMVARALKESGLPPHVLELEITESTAMQQTDMALRTLKRLKQMGVSLAIDDFGTGYSSLAYLRRFPVDKIKIDRTFVSDLPGDHDQGAIVSAIVALAHALQIKVVAEGVETEAQRDFLVSCGCDFIQGYLVGKPVDADAAAREYV